MSYPTAFPRLLVALTIVSLSAAGCADDAGGGGGSGGGSGQGPGGTTSSAPYVENVFGDCSDGGVSDAFAAEGLPSETSVTECTVTAVSAAPALRWDLTCEGADATITLTTSGPAPAVAPPVAVDDLVTIERWVDEFPGFDGSTVVRDAAGELLLAWVEGFDLDPYGAPADWADPLGLTSVDGLCERVDGDEHRAIDVTAPGPDPIRVYSRHAGTTSIPGATFEVRVSRSTYDPDVEGGCNSCFYYAVLRGADGG